MNQELFSYIAACPTAFQAVAHTAKLLELEGADVTGFFVPGKASAL